MTGPESITKRMDYNQFREVFEPLALIKFDAGRVEKMTGLYFQALKQFSFSVWRDVAMDYALSDSHEWPKPGWFANQCWSRINKNIDESRGIGETTHTDEECYCQEALKARSAFFRMVNELTIKTQPEQGTFLFGLNSAIVDQVEAMVKAVERDEANNRLEVR
jgi:hypothetical protein